MGKFIKTNNLETVKLLKSRGFTCLGEDENHVYTFLNDSSLVFEEEKPKNMVFTNVFCM